MKRTYLVFLGFFLSMIAWAQQNDTTRVVISMTLDQRLSRDVRSEIDILTRLVVQWSTDSTDTDDVGFVSFPTYNVWDDRETWGGKAYSFRLMWEKSGYGFLDVKWHNDSPKVEYVVYLDWQSGDPCDVPVEFDRAAGVPGVGKDWDILAEETRKLTPDLLIPIIRDLQGILFRRLQSKK